MDGRTWGTVLIALLLLTPGCAPRSRPASSYAPWPMSRQNQMRTAQSPYVGPQNARAVNGVSARSSNPLVAADGSLYAFADDKVGRLTPDGKVRWLASERTGLPLAVTPDGTVIAGGSDPGRRVKLAAFSPAGKKLWVFAAGKALPPFAPAIAQDGTIYLGSDRLYALRPNGKLKWSFRAHVPKKTEDPFFDPPAIGPDGTIYVTLFDLGYWREARVVPKESLFAVSPAGRRKWQRAVSGWPTHILGRSWVPGGPMVGPDGTIYVLAVVGRGVPQTPTKEKLYAFSPSGSLKKVLDPRIDLPVAAAIANDNTIYVGGAIREDPLSSPRTFGMLCALTPAGKISSGATALRLPSRTARYWTPMGRPISPPGKGISGRSAEMASRTGSSTRAPDTTNRRRDRWP